MSGKTNRPINQETSESYGDEAVEGATAIFKGDNKLDGAEEKTEEARSE